MLGIKLQVLLKRAWFFAVVLLALVAAGVLFSLRGRRGAEPDPAAQARERLAREAFARYAQLEAREREMDETVWAPEILAQKCGRTFELFWNALNATTNKFALVASFAADEFVLGRWDLARPLPHAIEWRASRGAGATLDPSAWRRFVAEFQRAGWDLVQVEFRHQRFDVDESGRPRESHFQFSAHLTRGSPEERATVEGDLAVDWRNEPSTATVPRVKRIDASRLQVKFRPGAAPFVPVLVEESPAGPFDPVLVYDLDGDGLSEVVLAGRNTAQRRLPGGGYRSEAFCSHARGPIFTGLIADFDRDGTADFLGARAGGLSLCSPAGKPDHAERGVWTATASLPNPMVLACGDIDADGDLDVFLGQYRVPALGQILRPNYYDANDGYPAYLLLNDGQGNFSDATTAAGLEQKRGRRIFSASFADLDADHDLDLLVVSDFAGVDLYQNDGRGRFTDVTHWTPEPHAFGMAHTLADFNADGRLDFLVIGMNSSTVDRLEHLKLWRPGSNEDRAMRGRMAFGNRLYFGRADGGFQPGDASLARSGWSWGVSAFDFDNDSFPDVYTANGHETQRSVADYEPEFWLHDRYIDDSIDDVAASAYYRAKFARTRGQGWSYGGYEKNRLYFNQRGKDFVEIGHLAGVALEADSRNVVADDLDGDGQVDLLVGTFEKWPKERQTLRLYQNRLNGAGNWIGFQFREERGKPSPVGARVTLEFDGRKTVRQIVTGDSYRSQHASTLHFGLGTADRVDQAKVAWPGGMTDTLRAPAVNRYHAVRAPEQTTK